jgi:predicted TIM-barrel fold metal-dependent hydrolase
VRPEENFLQKDSLKDGLKDSSSESQQKQWTDEEVAHAQRMIGGHRCIFGGDDPDEAITRKVLAHFDDMSAFDEWIEDINYRVPP